MWASAHGKSPLIGVASGSTMAHGLTAYAPLKPRRASCARGSRSRIVIHARIVLSDGGLILRSPHSRLTSPVTARRLPRVAGPLEALHLRRLPAPLRAVVGLFRGLTWSMDAGEDVEASGGDRQVAGSRHCVPTFGEEPSDLFGLGRRAVRHDLAGPDQPLELVTGDALANLVGRAQADRRATRVDDLVGDTVPTDPVAAGHGRERRSDSADCPGRSVAMGKGRRDRLVWIDRHPVGLREDVAVQVDVDGSRHDRPVEGVGVDPIANEVAHRDPGLRVDPRDDLRGDRGRNRRGAEGGGEELEVADVEAVDLRRRDEPVDEAVLGDCGLARWAAPRSGLWIADEQPGVPSRPLDQPLLRLALEDLGAVSYTHLRAHETRHDLVCR